MASKGVRFKDSNGNTVYPCPYYPVGSIYLSVNNVNPSQFFGGTWEQLKDRFLLGAGDTYTAGDTGGESTNTHNHYTTTSFDGGTGYIRPTQAVPRTRVITGGRANFNVTNYIIGATREDSTYNETINIMPPYLVVYMWKRTA